MSSNHRSSSPLSLVKITSITLAAGLLLGLAVNASAGTGSSLIGSVSAFFGFATAEVSTNSPAEPAPRRPLSSGTCDIGNNIEVEDGTTNLGYATLKDAFDAINAGTHTGTITIDVCGNTDEGALTAVLNASGTGSASYTSIAMAPTGGMARTIMGRDNCRQPYDRP